MDFSFPEINLYVIGNCPSISTTLKTCKASRIAQPQDTFARDCCKIRDCDIFRINAFEVFI